MHINFTTSNTPLPSAKESGILMALRFSAFNPEIFPPENRCSSRGQRGVTVIHIIEPQSDSSSRMLSEKGPMPSIKACQ
ncbi:unnamed protein product [Caretta caretta]